MSNTELITVPAEPAADIPRHAGNDPAPQYMQGFDGASVQPFEKRICDILLAPIEDHDVEIKPDGIVFAPGEWYRRRLTEAFGPGGWALVPRGPVRTRSAGRGGELVVYHGALYALGRYVGEAFGECTYWPNNAGMTYADAAEGAWTNCVDRCCKRLGMASNLWNRTWRDSWIAKNAEKARDEDGKWKWKKKSATPAVTVVETAVLPGGGTMVTEVERRPGADHRSFANSATGTGRETAGSAQPAAPAGTSAAAPSAPTSASAPTERPPTVATAAARTNDRRVFPPEVTELREALSKLIPGTGQALDEVQKARARWIAWATDGVWVDRLADLTRSQWEVALRKAKNGEVPTPPETEQ